MEVLIVFLIILAVTALLYWGAGRLGAPVPVLVAIAVGGVLIALLYLGANADELELDDDDGRNALLLGPIAALRKR
jgi:hypothetical protein